MTAIHSDLDQLLEQTIPPVPHLTHTQFHPHFLNWTLQQEPGVEEIALSLGQLDDIASEGLCRGGIIDRAVDLPPTYLEITLQVGWPIKINAHHMPNS